jgi:MoxR-like ATPase
MQEEIILQRIALNSLVSLPETGYTASRRGHRRGGGGGGRGDPAADAVLGAARADGNRPAGVRPARAALPALRHRVILRPEAELEGLETDQVLNEVIGSVAVPK